jgi:hypothetical protein
MNKSGYEEKKWHACHPLFLAENSQEIQHDCIFRRDNYREAIISDSRSISTVSMVTGDSINSSQPASS